MKALAEIFSVVFEIAVFALLFQGHYTAAVIVLIIGIILVAITSKPHKKLR